MCLYSQDRMKKRKKQGSVAESGEAEGHLTLQDVMKQNLEDRRADRASTFRPKGETPEERQARKKAVKFEQQVIRFWADFSSFWLVAGWASEISSWKICFKKSLFFRKGERKKKQTDWPSELSMLNNKKRWRLYTGMSRHSVCLQMHNIFNILNVLWNYVFEQILLLLL